RGYDRGLSDREARGRRGRDGDGCLRESKQTPRPRVWRGRRSRARGLFAYGDLHLVQTNGFDAVVLDFDAAACFVRADLRGRGHLAFTRAVLLDPKLEQGKRVLGRSRLVAGFPETHLAVRDDDDTTAAIRPRRLPCVAQVAAKPEPLVVGSLKAGDAEPSFRS